MFKRTLVVVTVLAVFALSILGAYALGTQAVQANVDGQAAVTAHDPGLILVSDEPVCPPSVPGPCG
jgi:hypothetical protein